VAFLLIFHFYLHNTSSCTVALGYTQPVTEMSTRNLVGGEGEELQPERKANNLTAIWELIV
jgi:hypothetical protein